MTDQPYPNLVPAPALATDTVTPPFDAAAYRPYLVSLHLTEEQERTLLETLWSIMHGFVELGFRYDVCAAVFGSAESHGSGPRGAIDSNHSDHPETQSDEETRP